MLTGKRKAYRLKHHTNFSQGFDNVGYLCCMHKQGLGFDNVGYLCCMHKQGFEKGNCMSWTDTM